MEIKANPVHPNAATAPKKNAQADSSGFAKILNNMTQSKPAQKIEAQPAALCRQIKPRSHLQLTSLNPVSAPPKAKPAALETIGESRILPLVLSTTR
ncbi:hypothetical protein [Pseudomonas sp. Irchel 3A5]|uniref:hypothetical protein n=1 Tax=Pseudomonas sp. Irchel 3A5 TaxID=2008911 RepID=UPI000BA37FF6|nr:hypothetical protein [Pseudomonas sp. Irchel 3A5]